MMDDAFVQIGATRDGLDPYLDCARARGMPAVLVETPDYLRWRAALGRRPFDRELAVERPHDLDALVAAVQASGVRPALVLTGFERYVHAGFGLARAMRTAPWPSVGEAFRPLDKDQQRMAVAAGAPRVRQPRHLGDLRFPQVIKPVDGGGGLCVFRVDDVAERSRAVDRIRRMRNYGGGEFAGVLAEEYVAGAEHSLQCVAVGGKPVVLAASEKLVVPERLPDAGLSGFREAGHIARHGSLAPVELVDLAADCLAAFGYREGPFHIDAILAADGPYFVEMGFRLSGGGIVGLVERVSGVRWAEVVFARHLEGRRPVLPPADPSVVVGQVSVTEDERERLPAGAEWVPFAPPPEISAPGLESDRLRHTGAAGRAVVTGDRATVRAALSDCIADRLGV